MYVQVITFVYRRSLYSRLSAFNSDCIHFLIPNWQPRILRLTVKKYLCRVSLACRLSCFSKESWNADNTIVTNPFELHIILAPITVESAMSSIVSSTEVGGVFGGD